MNADDNRKQLFLAEIETVCRKHSMSISHEDGHGSFLVCDFDEYLMKWLRDARLEVKS